MDIYRGAGSTLSAMYRMTSRDAWEPAVYRMTSRDAWEQYFQRLPDPELGWVLLDQLMERGEAPEVPWGLKLRADGMARRAPIVGDTWETARWGRVEVRELGETLTWSGPYVRLYRAGAKMRPAWGGWIRPESWTADRALRLLVPGDAPEWAR